MNDSVLVSRWRSWTPYLLSILRIVTAFLFMQVGTAKLFAFPGAIMPNGGTAPVGSLPGIAGVLETFGGLLLLMGLFTRPVAFLLSGEMAVAYFLRPRAAGLLAGSQSRRASRPVFVPVSLPLRRGSRALEHRCGSSPQPRHLGMGARRVTLLLRGGSLAKSMS